MKTHTYYTELRLFIIQYLMEIDFLLLGFCARPISVTQ